MAREREVVTGNVRDGSYPMRCSPLDGEADLTPHKW